MISYWAPQKVSDSLPDAASESPFGGGKFNDDEGMRVESDKERGSYYSLLMA